MLHIVCNKNGLALCLEVLSDTDRVLFIGEGVYAARSLACSHSYVLERDLLDRGLPIPTDVQPVAYDDWVELIAVTPKSATWK